MCVTRERDGSVLLTVKLDAGGAADSSSMGERRPCGQPSCRHACAHDASIATGCENLWKIENNENELEILRPMGNGIDHD